MNLLTKSYTYSDESTEALINSIKNKLCGKDQQDKAVEDNEIVTQLRARCDVKLIISTLANGNYPYLTSFVNGYYFKFIISRSIA